MFAHITLLSWWGAFKTLLDLLFFAWFPLYSSLKVAPVDLKGCNVIVTGGKPYSYSSSPPGKLEWVTFFPANSA